MVELGHTGDTAIKAYPNRIRGILDEDPDIEFFQIMNDDEKRSLDFQKQEAVLKSARETVGTWLELIKATDALAESMALHGYSAGAQHVEAASTISGSDQADRRPQQEQAEWRSEGLGL